MLQSTVAARQELPDVLWGVSLNSATLSTYGKEGYLVDLRPYYDDKEGASKTFWDRLESTFSKEELKERVNPEYLLNQIKELTGLFE